jgi:hypothetical protein
MIPPCLWDKGPPPCINFIAKVYGGVHTLLPSGFELRNKVLEKKKLEVIFKAPHLKNFFAKVLWIYKAKVFVKNGTWSSSLIYTH